RGCVIAAGAYDSLAATLKILLLLFCDWFGLLDDCVLSCQQLLDRVLPFVRTHVSDVILEGAFPLEMAGFAAAMARWRWDTCVLGVNVHGDALRQWLRRRSWSGGSDRGRDWCKAKLRWLGS